MTIRDRRHVLESSAPPAQTNQARPVDLLPSDPLVWLAGWLALPVIERVFREEVDPEGLQQAASGVAVVALLLTRDGLGARPHELGQQVQLGRGMAPTYPPAPALWHHVAAPPATTQRPILVRWTDKQSSHPETPCPIMVMTPCLPPYPVMGMSRGQQLHADGSGNLRVGTGGGLEGRDRDGLAQFFGIQVHT